MNRRVLIGGLLSSGLAGSAASYGGTIVKFPINLVTQDVTAEAAMEMALFFNNAAVATPAPISHLESTMVDGKTWTRGTIEINVEPDTVSKGWALGIDLDKSGSLQISEPYIRGETSLESLRLGGRARLQIDLPSCACTNGDVSCAKIQTFAFQLVDPNSLAILWGTETVTRTLNRDCSVAFELGVRKAIPDNVLKLKEGKIAISIRDTATNWERILPLVLGGQVNLQ